MRIREVKNGITLKGYAGTTGVLLAFDVTAERRQGLLGFAIRRKKGSEGWRWLQGLLTFPSANPPSYKPIDSNLAPIQKFRWSDYSVYPGQEYAYELQAVYGTPENLTYIVGPGIQLKTESISRGKHRIIFNRAVAASQAYSRRFQETNPDDENDSRHLEARAWLSRGMLEKIENFIEKARDENYALDLALFEFEYDGFVELLQKVQRRGVKVRVIYHGQPATKQTIANEEHLQPLDDDVKFPRLTTGLFHQKFIILRKRDRNGIFLPKAVLTGTANFTPNGLWRQANVVHIIHDKRLAQEYDTLYKQLLSSKGRGDTKIHIDNNHPIKSSGKIINSFSPRSEYIDINLLENTIKSADSEVFICSAFKLHDRITKALLNPNPGVIHFGLQNSRTEITGLHRNKSFTAPTYLRKGLEGFLKESTKGQSGSIYIHLKTIITDFTTNNPTVIVGSHNFSKSASDKNDENFVVIYGDTEVADTYFCEMMRLYDHYRFRYNMMKKGDGASSRLNLGIDNSWTNDYFNPNHLKFSERTRFSQE